MKNAVKNMKKDRVSAYVHKMRNTPSTCTQLYAFWMTPFIFPRVAYLIDGPFLNQKHKKDIRISYSLKHKHSKKYF